MPISDPPYDLCNIRLWLISLKDAVNGTQFVLQSEDAYDVLAVGSSPGLPTFIPLDAAHIQTGVLNNARVNWGSPSAIGSVTPSTGAFAGVITDSYASASNVPANINIRKYNGANFTTFTAMPTGHDLGTLLYSGTHNASALTIGAAIRAVTTEAWSATTTGTSVEIDTTANGTTGKTVNTKFYGQNGLNITKRADADVSTTTAGDLYFQSNSLWAKNTATLLRLKGLIYNSLNNVTVTNTVTETSLIDLSGANYSNLTFVANYLKANQVMRVRASGTFNATHTDRILTIRIKYGGTILSTASVTLTSVTADASNSWYLEAYFILRSIGTTGQIRGGGSLIYTASGSTPQTRSFQTNIDINTENSRTMDVTAIWNAASALNSITCHSMIWDWE